MGSNHLETGNILKDSRTMTLKKVINNHFPFKGYTALTFCPLIFVRGDLKHKFNAVVERHETTHALQQIECLWVFFLLIYGLEYLIKLPLCKFNHSRAYRSISFEREAYLWQCDKYYNQLRPHYSWRYFVFKLYNR